ncbi:MAG: glycosyltransferase [Opitutaceae bacterium]
MTSEEFPEAKGSLEAEIGRIAEEGPVILLIGELSPRKGIYEMLAAARKAKALSLDLQFVVAGPLDHSSCGEEDYPNLVSAFKNTPDNVHFRPGWIETDREFNGAIRGCSVLWGAYRGFPFSSNLLTKAALANRPILVSSGGLMEKRVREFKLGLVVDPEDSRAVIESLVELARTPRESKGFETGCREYAHRNSRRRLRDVLKETLPVSSVHC